MSNSPSASPPSPPIVRFERAPGFRTLFTNNFRYLPTTGEITITFSHIEGALPTGGPATVVDEAEVVMTYLQLKSFCEHMTAFITAYERDLGQIELPKALGPDVNTINTFVSNLKQTWGK
jgi:hypothetical protein